MQIGTWGPLFDHCSTPGPWRGGLAVSRALRFLHCIARDVVSLLPAAVTDHRMTSIIRVFSLSAPSIVSMVTVVVSLVSWSMRCVVLLSGLQALDSLQQYLYQLHCRVLLLHSISLSHYSDKSVTTWRLGDGPLHLRGSEK